MYTQKKICIVLPPNLPMPPIKGGAIETLMQYIAEVNEITPKFDITFISLWDNKVEKFENTLKHTKYVYYKWKKTDNLKWFLFRCIRKVLKININFLEPYENFVTNYILSNKFDFFLNESADFNSFRKVSKRMGKDKCYAHLHSEFSSNKTIDNTYGTIISVSEYIKKQWMKTSSIPPENIVVLKNCVDKNRFSKVLSINEKNSLRSQLGLIQDDFVIYFCGRIVPEKGILELINAVNEIKEEKVKLLIIGSPNFGNNGKETKYLKTIKKLVNENKNRIVFTGYIDNSELYKYYSISDCVIVPSIYEDPAPLVPIESIMAGKALIVTNSGGATEYVNNECSIIVKKEEKLKEQLKECILQLKKDKTFKEKLENSAKKKAESFTKEQYYNNFAKIFLHF